MRVRPGWEFHASKVHGGAHALTCTLALAVAAFAPSTCRGQGSVPFAGAGVGEQADGARPEVSDLPPHRRRLRAIFRTCDRAAGQAAGPVRGQARATAQRGARCALCDHVRRYPELGRNLASRGTPLRAQPQRPAGDRKPIFDQRPRLQRRPGGQQAARAHRWTLGVHAARRQRAVGTAPAAARRRPAGRSDQRARWNALQAQRGEWRRQRHHQERAGHARRLRSGNGRGRRTTAAARYGFALGPSAAVRSTPTGRTAKDCPLLRVSTRTNPYRGWQADPVGLRRRRRPFTGRATCSMRRTTSSPATGPAPTISSGAGRTRSARTRRSSSRAITTGTGAT